MRTFFVSGCDTGIGKTFFVRQLAEACLAQSDRVQVVKVVQTGCTAEEPQDVDTVRASLKGVAGITLFSYDAPLSPVYAAELQGKTLCFDEIVGAYRKLPPCDFRIVEGAGGLAVPLDEDGQDWADFAKTIAPDYTFLLVDDRLGAINQARLLSSYAIQKGLKAVGLVLNESHRQTDPHIHASFLAATKAFSIPYLGFIAFNGRMNSFPQIFTNPS